MKIEFNQWAYLLQLALDLGKENGYVVYDEREWNEHDGDYIVAKDVYKSDMFDETVFLSFKKCDRELESESKYVNKYKEALKKMTKEEIMEIEELLEDRRR